MIKVYLTLPPHTNATKTLLQEAILHAGRPVSPPGLLPDYSRILYLSPTVARRGEAQRVFHELVKDRAEESPGKASSPTGCYIPPEMATLDDLSKRLYSRWGDKRIVPASLVAVVLSRLSRKGLGFSTLLADLIRDIKRHYPDKGVDEIAVVFERTLDELNIPESVAKLPRECLDVLRQYQRFLEEKDLVDGNDVLNGCPGYLNGLPAPSGDREPDTAGSAVSTSMVRYTSLILDGFYDPEVSEKRLIRELVMRSEQILISTPYETRFNKFTSGYVDFLKETFALGEDDFVVLDGGTSSPQLRYCSYPDPEGEVEGIARNIKSLYVSGKARELERTVVTFPMLKKYAPMVERVFTRYGIPFDLSPGRPLARRRPFLDLISLLGSVSEDYPRLKFAQFLASHSFSKIPPLLRQWIPMLSLRSGIISGKESWLDLVARGQEAEDIAALPKDEIGKDLKWVFRKVHALEENRTSGTFDSCTGALKKVLDDLGFLDTPLQEAEQEGADPASGEKKAFHEVLELVSLLGDLYPENIGLSEFTEVIVHLLGSAFPEEKGRGVRVRGFFDAEGLASAYLYVGGLTDEAMPGRQDVDYFLPDSVKKRLGFLYLDKHLELQRFVFESVVHSSGHPYLSYPLTQGEALYLPSSFLYASDEVRERIPGIFSKEESLLASADRPFTSSIVEIGIAPGWLRLPQYLKVTDIDAYRFCPRKFFIERIARLAPLEIKEYEVEAITLGNILHKIMERIIGEPLKGLREFTEKAMSIADEVTGGKGLSSYWRELIRDTFLTILPEIYEKEIEIRREGYDGSVVEKTITGEPVKGIKLKGKIDRFDRVSGAVQIIDYKTGAAGLTCSQVATGNENLQLFLYAAIMKNQGYAVDRVGIYSLKDIQVKWCPSQRKVRGKGVETMDEYIVAALTFLDQAVGDMRRGDFSARPLNEYNCRNCHEYSVCPYIQQ